jgi:diketogulonate reductase-like aldo/keto reductase
MRAMEKLVDDGMIRFIGVSNFDLEDLQEAERSLRKHKLACNQVLYYLGSRGIEPRLVPYCAKKGIAVVGYSPFGHVGFPPMHSKGGQVIAEIATRNSKTPKQVILNFLTRHPNTFAIPKARNPEHVRENSGGAGWNLGKSDLDAIDAAFPVSDDETLGMI